MIFTFYFWGLTPCGAIDRPRKSISCQHAFVHCQFKACFLNAFECCSQVSNEKVSILSCDADILHLLGTLIRLNNFIEIFSHETRKCGQLRLVPLVGQPSVGNDMPVSNLVYRTVFSVFYLPYVGRHRVGY